MRLLYLYRYAILGGVSTLLANRLRFLKNHFDTHFAFLEDHGGRSAFGGYPQTCILPDSRALKEFIKKGRFALILPIDTPEAYRALRAADYRGIVINEVHTTTRNLAYLDSIRQERVSAFVTPSAYLAQRIENEFHYRGKVPCYIARNCIDAELFRFRPPETVPASKIVLWVGKLDDHKNWRGFLRLAQTVSKKRDDCEFWMAGGESATDDVVGQMFDLAGDFQLLDRLRWLPRVEYARMPLLYSLVRSSGGTSVSTSRNESFGMTIVESLACGCPVVAANVGAIPEILDGELSANLFPYDDTDRATCCLLRTLDDSECRQRFIEAGRSKVVATYGIEAAGEDYLKVLRKVCRPDQ